MQTAPSHPALTRAVPRPLLSWRVRQWLAHRAARPVRLPSSLPLDVRALPQLRIALVKWDAIGDFVLATTLLRLLHRRLPQDRLTLFCRSAVATLARNQFPGWQVVELPPRLKPLRRIYGQPAVRRLLGSQRPFDLLLDLRAMRDMGDSVLASWIPAGLKIGLANQYSLADIRLAGEDQLYHHLYPVPPPAEPGVPQDIENHRFLARLLFPDDPATRDLWPRLEVGEASRRGLAERLARESGLDSRPFLLVCPGALDPIKEYPVGRLAEAIRAVLAEQSLPVVVAGSEADRRTTGPLVSALAALAGGERVLDLTGRLDLAGHAALISLARAVLCMDSGTAHMAGALGRPAVVILGGGQPGMFAPWGGSARFRWLRNELPCYGCNWLCPYTRPMCIHDIAPALIARNLLEILAEPA